MSEAAVAAAAEKAEQAWSRHYDQRHSADLAVREALAVNGAGTGIAMGPQLDKAAQIAVDAVIDYADQLVNARDAKRDALAAERERDDIATTLPPPPPEREPPLLSVGDPKDIRAWLTTATATQVHDALSAMTGDTERVAWANQLMAWVREDGQTSEVIEVLRAAQPLKVEEPAAEEQD